MRVIMQRMLKDLTFMAEHNIMDYSLLLIIECNQEYIDAKEEEKKMAKSRGLSVKAYRRESFVKEQQLLK